MKYRFTDFEDFLATEYSNDYTFTDDDLSDRCNGWIADLDPQELIDYANQYAKHIKGEAADAAQVFCDDLLNTI